MSNAIVVVQYLLSELGRKASIVAGGDGRQIQRVEVPASPEALALASVDTDGKAIVLVGHRVTDQGFVYGFTDGEVEVEFDSPQDPATLLTYERDRREAVETARREARERDERLSHERYEALVAAVLATPVDAMLEYSSTGHYCPGTTTCGKVPWDDSRLEVKHAEVLAEIEARHQARLAREAEREQERLAAEAAEAAEREAWVREHGSERLRLALDMGLLDKSLTVYEEERLESERPGWERDVRDAMKVGAIRNPPEYALRALAEARQVCGEQVQLRYARLHSDEYEDSCSWRGPVLYDETWPHSQCAVMLRLVDDGDDE